MSCVGLDLEEASFPLAVAVARPWSSSKTMLQNRLDVVLQVQLGVKASYPALPGAQQQTPPIS
jgi:hypothetical protein